MLSILLYLNNKLVEKCIKVYMLKVNQMVFISFNSKQFFRLIFILIYSTPRRNNVLYIIICTKEFGIKNYGKQLRFNKKCCTYK